MRVTNAMMSNKVINNINRNLTNVDRYFMQMTTGKKIQVPSDNPLIASRALKFRSIVSRTEQYKENVNQAKSWMEITDTAFGAADSILTQMRELCIEGGNDKPIEDQKAIAKEYNSMLEELEKTVNQTYMGRYIFSGYKTDTPPITKDASGNNILNPDIYNGVTVNQKIEIEVGVDNNIPINSNAPSFYTQEVFDGLHAIGKKIEEYDKHITDGTWVEGDANTQAFNTDLRDLFDKTIGNIDEYKQKFSDQATDIGVRESRLELVGSRLGDDHTNYTNLMANNEDLNVTEAYMNWSVADSVYTAALKVGMSITKLTLADYL